MPEPFTGRRVLVIGPGNSGVDIAADLCTVTEHTVLCARSPVLIMPRMMFGVPNSRTLGKIEKPWVPWAIRIKHASAADAHVPGPHGAMGLSHADHADAPDQPSDADLAHRLAPHHGPTRHRDPSPAAPSPSSTASTDAFDAIIAATGYVTTFPYLDPASIPRSPAPVRYSTTASSTRRCPGLFFVGLFDVSGGSNIRMMDDQSEYVAAIATGRVKLPDTAGMQKCDPGGP